MDVDGGGERQVIDTNGVLKWWGLEQAMDWMGDWIANKQTKVVKGTERNLWNCARFRANGE